MKTPDAKPCFTRNTRSCLFRILLSVPIFLALGHIPLDATPVPPNVKKIVIFIYTEDAKGSKIPLGTGFFVAVPSLGSNSNTYGYVYAVTAKHVVFPENTTGFRPLVYIRLNNKKGGSNYLPIQLIDHGDNKNIFVSDDPAVDVAVIAVAPDVNAYDFLAIPEAMITKPEDFKAMRIREGTSTFFTGLFAPYPGDQRIYPVVKFGTVALVTDEKVPWIAQVLTNGVVVKQNVKTELYLLETPSAGGNSGSPVFFYLGADREPGSINLSAPVLKLAGIMLGYYPDPQPLLYAQTDTRPFAPSNSGVAAIAPAYKIREILFSRELSDRRTHLDAQIPTAN